MDVNDFHVSIHTLTKFFNAVRLAGDAHHDRATVTSVRPEHGEFLAQVADIAVPDAASPVGTPTAFSLQYLRSVEATPLHDAIILETDAGDVVRMVLGDLAAERHHNNKLHRMTARFTDAMREVADPRVLDIGGRARSGQAHRWEFPEREHIVFDVMPGPEVDVVGDAHHLSAMFPPEHFDAFVSVSVFEHLLTPWVVVCEINHVLKPGGLGFVVSHQTVGLHDQPSDFWRFSDQAWRAMFNVSTGFEIVQTVMEDPQYVLPILFRPGSENKEQAAGYEASAVMVRKIGPTSQAWAIPVAELKATSYPPT